MGIFLWTECRHKKDIFFTFKHHTDVIVSNLQHRFFLSAFGSEMVIRDRRDTSVWLNLLLLFISTALSTVKRLFNYFLTIPQHFCFLLCNIYKTRYYEPHISRLRHSRYNSFIGMDLSKQDRISDSLLYCKSVQWHIRYSIFQVSIYMFEICYFHSLLNDSPNIVSLNFAMHC